MFASGVIVRVAGNGEATLSSVQTSSGIVGVGLADAASECADQLHYLQ